MRASSVDVEIASAPQRRGVVSGKLADALRKKPLAEINRGNQLSRVLGLRSLVLFGFSAVVGGGIFRSTGLAAFHYTGQSLYLAYIIGGVCCFCTGLCYIEFAKKLHAAGGAYSFVYASVGELAAVIAALCLTFEYAVASACISRAASEYLSATLLSEFSIALPWASTYSAHKGIFSLDPVAPCICAILSCLAGVGLRRGQRVSSVVSCVNISLIFVVLCTALTEFKATHFTEESSTFPFGWRALIRAASDVSFNFTGYSAIVTLGEEVHNPEVTLPRALAIVLFLVSSLYISMSIALIGLVNYRDIDTNAPFIGGFENTKSLGWMGKVVTTTVLLCACNAVYSSAVGQPRVWFGVSRDGLLPSRFQTVWGVQKVPLFSLVITGIVMSIFAGFFKYETLQGITSAALLFLQALVSLGCLVQHLNSKTVILALAGTGISAFLLAAFLLGGQVKEDPLTRRFHLPDPIMEGVYISGASLCLAVITFISLIFCMPIASAIALAAFVMNCFLLGSIELTSLAFFASIAFTAAVLYFCYGIKHSTLNVN